MSKSKTKKTWWQILLIILMVIAILVGLVLFGARLYFRLPVSDYYKISEKTFVIPGIKDGYIAQGLEYRDGIFYATGYMKDGSASPIYMVDKETNKRIKTVYMQDENGQDYHGHCGGLSVKGEYIYVASGSGILAFDRSAVENAADGAKVSCLGKFETKNGDDSVGVSFTFADDNYFVVGEFYRDVVYPTADNHKLTTPAGDYNQALGLVYFYSDAEDAVFGIDPEPKMLFSFPDQVQGMTIKDDKIYLSTSYSVPSSHILVYDVNKMTESSIDFMGQSRLIKYCDSASLIKDNLIAPMSEEIVIVDDKLYVMCESASNKYIFGKFTSAKWCYATNIEDLVR